MVFVAKFTNQDFILFFFLTIHFNGIILIMRFTFWEPSRSLYATATLRDRAGQRKTEKERST